MPTSISRALRRFGRRHRSAAAVAVVAALVGSAPVAAAPLAKFVLGALNPAPATTTIQMAAPGPVLSLQNSGGSAGGLSVTVPSGQAPITVSAGAGTATNLDADRLDGHDASDFVQGAVESWHEVGAPGEPGWGRFSLISYPDPAFTATVGFLKDPLGFVHLRGRVFAVLLEPDGCDTYALFTLPAGYRPAGPMTVAAIAYDSDVFANVVAQVDVLASGAVGICFPRLSEHSWVSLDGITFQAAP